MWFENVVFRVPQKIKDKENKQWLFCNEVILLLNVKWNYYYFCFEIDFFILMISSDWMYFKLAIFNIYIYLL